MRLKRAALGLMCLLLGSYAFAQVDEEPEQEKKGSGEPDYTKGAAAPDRQSTGYQALGPTGLIGYIARSKPVTMTLIREVTDGSPASGKIDEGDVIVGIGSGRFKSDVRRELSAAVTEAEKRENNGKLVLNVWRKRTGKAAPVTLTLPVMGTYSPTSPWECPKTDKLIEEAAKWIVDHPRGGIAGNVGALALLATGEKKYIRHVSDKANGAARKAGGGPWDAGYKLIMMSEYYLATKDSSVKSGIRAQAEHIAKGQSSVGTYGHGYATPCGAESGYGCMNQCSISCILGMVLAQKCGISSPQVDQAIGLGLGQLRWYVDKGTVPYGYHGPNTRGYDNNGRNSQCAVLFDIYGDSQAAEFFTRCTVASYNQREGGHTGNFWSWLWGGLGAGRGGPDAANSFLTNTRWFTELERRGRGRYHYQPQLGGRDTSKYNNWDTTGSRLLHMCLPRKAIYITGKGGSSFEPLTGPRLKETLDVLSYDPSSRSETQLLADLGNWSWKVRWDAAMQLGKRDKDVSRKLLAMVDSPDRHTRYGACVGLRQAGRKENISKIKDKMVKVIETSDDQAFQYYAVNALRFNPWNSKHNLKGEVFKAAPDLMRLIAKLEAEGNDPFNRIPEAMIENLWHGGHLADFRGYSRWDNIKPSDFDDKTLLPAIAAGLRSPNGGTRSSASGWLKRLDEKQLEQIWDAIWYGASTKAPGNGMFAGAGQQNCKDAIARGRFKEGMEAALEKMRNPGWGAFASIPGSFRTLSGYGSHIKPYLPEMQKIYDKFVAGRKPKEVENMKKSWAMVQANIDKKVELRSIKDFVKDSPTKGGRKNFVFQKPEPGQRFAGTPTAGASAATPAAVAKPKPLRAARSITPGKQEALDKALISTLKKLSESGSLKEKAIMISPTRAKVWLKSVADEGLTFQLVGGTRTAAFKWEDMKPADRATLALLVAALKSDSHDAQAMAAVYLESFGKVKEADAYFEKAGDASTKKLAKLFD